jgi:predicted nucleic acid-binding protein
MILVDTNILVRHCRADDPLNSAARHAIRALGRANNLLVLAPQNLYEFWVVATRPIDMNGLGMPTDRALNWLGYAQRICRLLPDPPNLFSEWERLLRVYNVSGKAGHDARLVAAMQLHGIASILTFNTAHFTRYGVTILDPRTLAST